MAKQWYERGSDMDIQMGVLETQCLERQAQGVPYTWHKFYVTWWSGGVRINDCWFQGTAIREWVWRCLSVNGQVWHHHRVVDFPNGVSNCGTCGDGSDNRMPYGTQTCLTEPDKAHWHCIMGYARESKNGYVRRQMEQWRRDRGEEAQ